MTQRVGRRFRRRLPLRAAGGPGIATTRLRIAFVTGTLAIGGTELQMARLATELKLLGHDVAVFAASAGGPVGDTLERNRIPWQQFDLGNQWVHGRAHWRQPKAIWAQVVGILRLARAMRRFRPDVYFGYLYWAYMIASPIAALLRVPVRITTRRGLGEGRTSQTLRWMPRFVNTLIDVVITNSELVGAEAVAIEGLPEAKLRVIHNGVDVIEPADVAVEPPVGLMVANLISYKGHEDVITALSLLDDPPTVRFVGEGPERARLEHLVEAANLGERVVFEGSVANAARLFRTAQFGILASHEESLPNCVLEAMAAGVPMVATSVGGVPELLEHEVNALLVPPRAPDALARAIKRLVDDPGLRVRLGAAAHERAQQFSWPVCVQAHLDVISEVATHRV
jgi:glycosyltransferase involved in cell wall biosynthesis